ncbi:winged helix-turn-helix transcriptional regulator [Aeropyrum pernix]|uniref:winged helix-turn-helix transcriptional regulator n=1 Tax=Aeropyrum pernix TaxID=56636 RepID=UPI001037B922|nr:helix-turn-helix domain-containing protein [Aeropyrum pernix]
MDSGDCPITAASRLLSRKWSLVIVYHLLDGDKGFAELEKSIGAISSKTLSETLEDLRILGIVERIIDPGPPVRVRYRLTEMGEDMRSVLMELARWSCKWVVSNSRCGDILSKITKINGQNRPWQNVEEAQPQQTWLAD